MDNHSLNSLGILITNVSLPTKDQDQKTRDLCLKRLKQKEIDATFHYIPLHSSPYGINHLGYKMGDLPITEELSSTLVRLPIYPGIKKSDLHYIVDCLYEIFKEI